jgi:hypothetical protein
MSKFLLNLLVEFLQVLQKPNSIKIQKSISYLNLSWNLAQFIVSARSPSAGRHLPRWPCEPARLWSIHRVTLCLLSCAFQPTHLLSPLPLTHGPHV